MESWQTDTFNGKTLSKVNPHQRSNMGSSRKSGKAPDEAPPAGQGEAERKCAGGRRRAAVRPGLPAEENSEVLRAARERDFGLFMAQVKESFGELTQQDLAALLGVKKPTVSAAKQRGRVPLSWIIRLRRLLGNERWPAPPPEDDSFPGLLGETAGKDGSARLREHAGKPVRIYGTKCEWPRGRKRPAFPVVGYETLSRRFTGEGVLVFRVEGSAMRDTLGPRSLVGVDSGDHIPVSGALFAVYMPGEGVIIRRFSHAGDKILLCADHASLPPFEMTGSDLERHMVGRCLWAMREL